jgi:regulator of sigma D
MSNASKPPIIDAEKRLEELNTLINQTEQSHKTKIDEFAALELKSKSELSNLGKQIVLLVNNKEQLNGEINDLLINKEVILAQLNDIRADKDKETIDLSSARGNYEAVQKTIMESISELERINSNIKLAEISYLKLLENNKQNITEMEKSIANQKVEDKRLLDYTDKLNKLELNLNQREEAINKKIADITNNSVDFDKQKKELASDHDKFLQQSVSLQELKNKMTERSEQIKQESGKLLAEVQKISQRELAVVAKEDDLKKREVVYQEKLLDLQVKERQLKMKEKELLLTQ